MRTFYGVVPTLTDRGHKTDKFAPVKIDFREFTEDQIETGLATVSRLLPTDKREDPLEYRIDVGDQVGIVELPGGLRYPDDIYVRISLNQGMLTNKVSLNGRTKPKNEGGFGIVETVASILPEQDPYVIVRDKYMRDQAEGVVFTPEFLRRSFERGRLIDLSSLVEEKHTRALGRSMINMINSDEGGWIEGVGIATVYPLDPGITQEKPAADLLRRLGNVKEVADAVIRVNGEYGSPVNPRFRRSKEAS